MIQRKTFWAAIKPPQPLWENYLAGISGICWKIQIKENIWRLSSSIPVPVYFRIPRLRHWSDLSLTVTIWVILFCSKLRRSVAASRFPMKSPGSTSSSLGLRDDSLSRISDDCRVSDNLKQKLNIKSGKSSFFLLLNRIQASHQANPKFSIFK